MVSDVERAWSRIESWMEAQAPEALQALRPGADEDTIRQAEEALEQELPESLRRSVARHDGQEVDWPSLIGYGFLLPLAEVVNQGQELRGEDWWPSSSLPFGWRDGDYLSVDLAKGNDGKTGQVLCFLHDSDPIRSVLAPDVGRWLDRWADELEAGMHELDRAPGAGLVPIDESRSRIWPV